jgi:phosphatidylglycerophosphate synthase
VKSIDTTILSPLERALCRWADRAAPFVPAPILPNHITIAGFLSALAAAVCFYASDWSALWIVPACAGVACHMITDSLDGAVARHRGQTSDRGFFLDHTLDSMAFVGFPIALGLSGQAHMEVTVFAVLALFLHANLMQYGILLNSRKTLPRFGPIDYEAALILTAILHAAFPDAVLSQEAWSFGIYDIVFGAGALVSLVEFAVLWLKLARSLPGIAHPDDSRSAKK